MDSLEDQMLAEAIALSMAGAGTGDRATDQNNDSLLQNLVQSLLSKEDKASEGAKMVLCVRKDLGLSVGKIAAQCSHATLGLYKLMRNHFGQLLDTWEGSASAKIVLEVEDEATMLKLQEAATALGLPTHIVCDAGKTEIARGTRTVLAIAGLKSEVDKVTGKLRLLH